MSNNVWKEYSICTDEQKATVQNNETMDGIILKFEEVADKRIFRMYLSYDEALELGKQIRQFANECRK